MAGNPSVAVSLGTLAQSQQTIASGTTTPGFNTNGLPLVGIQMPAVFAGTVLTFLVASTLGGAYQQLYNSSGPVSYTVAQGRFQAINPVDFYGVQFLKIVSNASETAATLNLSLKGI